MGQVILIKIQYRNNDLDQIATRCWIKDLHDMKSYRLSFPESQDTYTGRSPTLELQGPRMDSKIRTRTPQRIGIGLQSFGSREAVGAEAVIPPLMLCYTFLQMSVIVFRHNKVANRDTDRSIRFTKKMKGTDSIQVLIDPSSATLRRVVWDKEASRTHVWASAMNGCSAYFGVRARGSGNLVVPLSFPRCFYRTWCQQCSR